MEGQSYITYIAQEILTNERKCYRIVGFGKCVGCYSKLLGKSASITNKIRKNTIPDVDMTDICCQKVDMILLANK